MKNPLDLILDKSIYFSFDATGFERHARSFDEDLSEVDLCKKNYLVTGGSGGIGAATVEFLSKRGANVYYTGRRENPPFSGDKQTYFIWDMVNWNGINSLAEKLPKLDGVVLNAGGMPDELTHNEWGYEYQFASHLMGHYFLVRKLEAMGLLNMGCRILWVTSGGMFLRKFSVDLAKTKSKYDKVAAYANAKRAQVILMQEMSNDPLFTPYTIGAMHPGWVDTRAVEEALPKFYNFTKGRLRRPDQGADTICWFLASGKRLEPGKLWFDRKEVDCYPVIGTKESSSQRSKLVELVRDVYNFIFN